MVDRERLKRDWKSGKKHNWLVYGLVIVLGLSFFGVIGFSGTGIFVHYPNGSTTTFLQTNTASNLPTQGSGPVQAQVAAYNWITGAAMTSLSTEQVFLPGSTAVFDSSSSTANPVQFGGSYNSGGSYWIQIAKSGYSKTLTPIVAGALSLSGGQTYANLGNVFTIGNPTYSTNCFWGNGTAFNSAKTYNFTTTSTSQQNMKCTVSNTATGTGYIPSWNPTNQQTDDLVCYINDTATAGYLSMQGISSSSTSGMITRSTTRVGYWIVPSGITVGNQLSPDGQPVNVLHSAISSPNDIASSGITYYQPVSSATTYGGSYTFTFTIGDGTLPHGSSEAINVGCDSGADVTMYNGPNQAFGNFGPDQTSVVGGWAITFAK